MRSITVAVVCVLLVAMPTVVSADLIYLSATMGTPGQPVWGHLLLGQLQFGGARFEITEPTWAEAVGGHFATYYPDGGPNLFGALVALSGETDVPDSGNLSTPDVLRTVAFDPTGSSSDHVIPIDPVLLTPGWYAVVFGAGLHGSLGGNDNSAQLNNSPYGSPKYLTWTPTGGWGFSSSFWPRYTVYGHPVPEPSTAAMVLLAAAALAGFRLRRTNARLVGPGDSSRPSGNSAGTL